MKQVLQSLTGGQIFVGEVAAPTAQPGMLLVRNRCSAISVGTERATIQQVQRGVIGNALTQPQLVQAVFRQLVREGLGPTLEKIRSRLEQPLPLGYSCAGVVQEVGEGVDGFQLGTPVACAGYGYASHAEWISVPKNLCVKIPKGVSWEEASFTTLGAIALQGVRVADLEIGETVLILGLGIIGQLIAQAAQAAGCRIFGVDPRLERVAIAKEGGMEEGTSSNDPQQLLQAGQLFTAGHGFDAVIIAAATEETQPLLLAGELARERGRVVVVGEVPLEVPRQRFYEKELQLRLARSYGPGRYDPTYERHGLDYPFGFVRWTAQRNMMAFLQLVSSGKVRVSPLITHRFPIHQAAQAYELVVSGTTPPLGLLLQYEATTEAPASIQTITAPGQPQRVSPGTVGIGVIGAGRFCSGVILPILRKMPDARILRIVTDHGLSAQAVAHRFRIPSSATDYRSILQDPSIQALIIATPHHLHAQMVLEGLRNSRHLFVEKPLCLKPEELEEIAATYRSLEAQLILSVGFNRRFSWAARAAKDWFRNRQGPLTMVYRVNAGPAAGKNDWLGDPLMSGGRVLGEIGHFIDLMSFFPGAVPVKVSTEAPRLEEGQPAHETLIATLSFSDGSLGTLAYAASGDSICPKERIELFGDGRVVFIDDFRSVVAYVNGRMKVRRRWTQEKGFQGELEAFIHAIRSGRAAPVPFPEIYATTLATFKALESLRSGRPVPIESLPDAKR